jgi:hypothetical protein
MAGVDPRIVQELLGHETLGMTLRYSHLSPAHQLDAVRRLDAAPTATATATQEPVELRPTADGAEVMDFPLEMKWRRAESNCGPRDYETLALAN